MPLNLSDVKQQIQDHLQEGLLIVAGSGLSAAEGIPGMKSLADHLISNIKSRIITCNDDAWDIVVTALQSGNDLEGAMQKATLKDSTVDAVVALTSEYIRVAESLVFDQVMQGSRILPFTTFIKHLFKAGKQFHLITPNYDRLIELATEAAHIGVDSRFCGQLYGIQDPKRSSDAHRESYYNGKIPSFRSRMCLHIYKPHGSLDLYECDGKVIRCPFIIKKNPLIITPGLSKYKESYKWAYDDQRTAGNQAVSKANKLIFIGYGFNDDHLEQYICPNLCLSKPSIIIAKELSSNAIKVINNSKDTTIFAICALPKDESKSKIISSNGEEIIVNENLWSLDGFNKGVLHDV